ncbi:MAG: hypothetical protein SCM96_02310 [Acidobacteriota bacterium]|nr:hypothetical protein [Acidobacteriota bacterium]
MSDILRALRSPRIFAGAFDDVETWRAWMVFLAAAFGLPIVDGRDLEIYRKCTGRQFLPTGPFREVFCVSGRRSGKSRLAALIAVFLATFRDWRNVLSPGERGKAIIIATDRAQAKVIHGYISGLLNSNPSLGRLIIAEGKESIELSTGVDIEIATANYRSIRGRTVIFACMEELAFWRSSEIYANPATEILRALKPSLATAPGSLLLGISSAYARQGLLWEMVSKHHGKDSDVLTWVSDSLTMNPTLDRAMIERELEADPSAARAEWLSVFRDDVESFLGLDLLESAVVPGRIADLQLEKGAQARGFIDPSGGRQDSYTAAVASRNPVTGRIVVNAVREKRPPFSPEAVTADFAEFFRGYRVSTVTCDHWGGEWVCEIWRKNGFRVEASKLSASEIYVAFLALVASGKVELPDNVRLKTQLLQLERRVRPGGKDQVTHPAGLHDDLANAAAGAAVLASRQAMAPRIRRLFDDSFGGETPKPIRRPSFPLWDGWK